MNIQQQIDQFLQTAKKPLIVILGQTGCGKTFLSLHLAEKYNGEIVNADSRQIYRGMDIGTAKIRQEEMQGIPHHLLSFKNPDEIFTVAEYKTMAVEKIENILERKKIPFLVGGTGLYINAVCLNYSIPKLEPDWKLRKQLEEEDKKKGGEYLYEKLQKLDPNTAKKIHPNQKRHLLRAIEIALQGKKKSEEKKQGTPLFDCFFIGIDIPREILYKRINERVEKMFEEGLLQEVQLLLSRGYDEKSHAMNGIGYKEVLSYIRGDISLETSKELLKQHTRNYAKRQMTWFRRLENVYWVE